jgi:spermidine/putrescine ABC transporter ATP-binding subunit
MEKIMPSSEPMISISGVSKHFGPVKAVNNVSLDIARNEFFAILGASGSGKTTLLRMLAGFEIPNTGEIYIEGEPVSEIRPNHRPTNMVFQSYAIFPHLNVRENISYGLLNKKMTKAKINEEVDAMLELIRLPNYGHRAAHQLSGGERQRVALARALICHPKVLLLDEPLGALDKKLREEMQIELRQLQRKVGITFVFVTHDQEEALTMADRIAVMSEGKIIQVDTPGTLYETPSNIEVAEFIGNINLLRGTVESTSDNTSDIVVIDAGQVGQLSVPKGQNKINSGDSVVLAVRPEKLRITTEAPGNGYNGIRGKMIAESYAGDRSYYYLNVEGLSRRLRVANLNEYPSAVRSKANEDEEVWVVWPIESGLLLTA